MSSQAHIAPIQAQKVEKPAKRFWGFTKREIQVLEAVIETGSMLDTAKRLCISDRTVEAHFVNMRAKAELASTYQLIAAFVIEKVMAAAGVAE
jgi:DNA-binding NarL/FixJ family response regulator